MRRLIAFLTLLGILCLSAAPATHAGCNARWTQSGFKSYRQVESEVRSRHGDVKILRVMLCEGGGSAYFQIVVLNSSGTVQNLRVEAR